MYEDKTLICKECGKEFVFTAGEQEFYASKGFRDVRHAVTQERMHLSQSVKCSQLSVLLAARKLRFHSSLVKTDLYTAASALQR